MDAYVRPCDMAGGAGLSGVCTPVYVAIRNMITFVSSTPRNEVLRGRQLEAQKAFSG